MCKGWTLGPLSIGLLCLGYCPSNKRRMNHEHPCLLVLQPIIHVNITLTTSILQVGPVHPVPAHRDLELLQPRDGRHGAHPGDLPAGQAEERRQHRQQGPEPQWTLNTVRLLGQKFWLLGTFPLNMTP